MSSLCGWFDPDEFVGITFLKKMLEETNMMAEANAQTSPRKLDADMSNVHASMTPTVNGSNEMYVDAEYLTPKSIAYAATVKSGDNA